jgi:hypothetical protein
MQDAIKRGFAKPPCSAMLSHSALMERQKEARSVDRDINTSLLTIFPALMRSF